MRPGINRYRVLRGPPVSGRTVSPGSYRCESGGGQTDPGRYPVRCPCPTVPPRVPVTLFPSLCLSPLSVARLLSDSLWHPLCLSVPVSLSLPTSLYGSFSLSLPSDSVRFALSLCVSVSPNRSPGPGLWVYPVSRSGCGRLRTPRATRPSSTSLDLPYPGLGKPSDVGGRQRGGHDRPKIEMLDGKLEPF